MRQASRVIGSRSETKVQMFVSHIKNSLVFVGVDRTSLSFSYTDIGEVLAFVPRRRPLKLGSNG